MENIVRFTPPDSNSVGSLALPGPRWNYVTQVISDLWMLVFAWPDAEDEMMANVPFASRYCVSALLEKVGKLQVDFLISDCFPNVTLEALKDAKSMEPYRLELSHLQGHRAVTVKRILLKKNLREIRIRKHRYIISLSADGKILTVEKKQ